MKGRARNFMETGGACLISYLLLLSTVQFCKGQEFRGLWVDAFGPGFLNRQQVRQLVEDCRKYNFNAVIVEMRKRGDAYYFPKAPNEEPRATGIPADFDALAEIIKECHKEPRIQVHCWIVGYFIWAYHKPPPEPNHVFNKHRELLMKDSIGQTIFAQGSYLDPGNPDANQYLLNVAKDIVSRYDIDGLHWDYLRYPSQDSGYNEVAMKRYKEEFGVKEDPAPKDERFCDWRRRQVTDFTRWSTAELLAIKPNLVISASVFSNYKDSFTYRLQDWVAWDREGIVDVSMPMDFTKDNESVFQPRADFALTNHWNRWVYVGQAGYMNSKENTLKQLSYCRQKGFKGTALYSYRKPALTKAPAKSENENAIVVDNTKAEVVGNWSTGEFGKKHGADYRFIPKGSGSNYVRFAADLPQSGEYDVYEWHVAGKNRAKDAPFKVADSDGRHDLKVNQQQNGARWNKLGTYHFEAGKRAEVKISNLISNSNEVVIADAIKFVRSGTSDEDQEAGDEKDDLLKALAQTQQDMLEFLKQKFQPEWKSVPELPWRQTKGIIKGVVVDSSTGEPLYNATVTLNSNPQRTQKSEPHGAFVFFDVEPGNYRLAIEVRGHKQELGCSVRKAGITSVDIRAALQAR